MLASLADAPLDDPQFVYEPKYDGIRAIAEIGGQESGKPVKRQADSRPPNIRISEMARGDGRALYERAIEQGWEGLIAKRADSKYRSGKRTPDWRKLKIVHEQEFVVGGWTDPRHTRSCFGALLLGVYESQGRSVLDTPERHGARASARGGGAPRELIYVGHTGTGFDERELDRVMTRLKPLETQECPFRERPKTNEKPHWVRPSLVAQIKFTEWTADGNLRHPVYLGLRSDKNPREVIREAETRIRGESNRLREPADLIDQLRELEKSRRDGVLVLPNGDRLKVTNLHKVFWPKQKLTKGDLFRYYAGIAPYILPAVADRPLVMKRFPNGIAGQPFYQHRAEAAPPGVRVEQVATGAGSERRPQIIGGNLTTLLYTTQLAAISQDPWFSRVSSPLFADYVALDLDPPSGVTFDRVLDVARWIRDELDALGVMGVPKTSGADGLHIYVPLPPGTPYEAGLLFCQIVATVVAQKHAGAATVERSVKARGSRVYVDYMQNVLGKTLATAYSARASAYAGVSAPLTWKEIDNGVRREDLTIVTMPARIKKVGDLWATLRQSKGADLLRVARYANKTGA